jgi:hypothetical protein
LLDHQHLIAKALSVELAQIGVVLAFDDEGASHTVGDVQGRGAVFMSMIPVRPWRLSHLVLFIFINLVLFIFISKPKAIGIGPNLILRPHVGLDLLLIHRPQLHVLRKRRRSPLIRGSRIVLFDQALLVLAPVGRKVIPHGRRAILFARAENPRERFIDEDLGRSDDLMVRASQCGPHEEEHIVTGGAGRRMGPVEVEVRRARSVQAVWIRVTLRAGIELLTLGVDFVAACRIRRIARGLIERVRKRLRVHLVQKLDFDQVSDFRTKRGSWDRLAFGEGIFGARLRRVAQVAAGEIPEILRRTTVIAC